MPTSPPISSTISNRARRPYQAVAMALQARHRVVGFYWARRCRKSSTAGDIYFQEMGAGPGRTVINCSASLALGRESLGMTLSASEYAEMLAAEAAAVRSAFERNAAAIGPGRCRAAVANARSGREYRQRLGQRDFTHLYQSRAMELRLYFNRTEYSRELILAPSIHTFRSYRALVGFDEFGYLPGGLARELIDSADAMMRDTPDRRMLFFCNLCLSDHHPWYEMTLPRNLTAVEEAEAFPPQATGHVYLSHSGLLIHRVALHDAYLAGHQLYDDRGRPLTYEQCLTFPSLRGGWEVSYGLNHKPGGASVVDLAALVSAQQRGAGRAYFLFVDNEADFQLALNRLHACLGDGPVGIGFDVATTTAEISNPSSVTVREKVGSDHFDRLKLVWKERKPQIARGRLERLILAVRQRPAGGPARRLCVDASNERYFAEETAEALAPLIPVQLVLAGQVVEPPPPGYSLQDGRINYKTWLGDLEAATVNDGRLALPPDEYVRTDYRLVLKSGGRFFCVPDARTGAHGDTFDSGKLAGLALLAASAGTILLPSGQRAHILATRRRRVEGIF